MAFYKVYLGPGDLGPRKYTAGQFMAQFGVLGGGKSQVLTLRHPIRVVSMQRDTAPRTVRVLRLSTDFFHHLADLAKRRSVITALSWAGARLGPQSLFALNVALRTPARRAGGLNIVRHWLEIERDVLIPTRGTVAELFDYLEIRPLFTAPLPQPAPAAKHYV